MTQEQKELLFKDLCARLPHGVKICYEAVVQVPEGEILESIDVTTNIVSSKSVVANFQDVKPYLFPMLSMTENQKIIYGDLCYAVIHSLTWNMQAELNKLVD